MIKNSQGNAEKVKNPYKIGLSCISMSKLGYKTPFYIRPVQNPWNWRRTDQNMDLICQSLRYATDEESLVEKETILVEEDLTDEDRVEEE